MPKCDFKKVASAWVFSCKFAAYFQNIFPSEHLWTAASEFLKFIRTVFANLLTAFSGDS